MATKNMTHNTRSPILVAKFFPVPAIREWLFHRNFWCGPPPIELEVGKQFFSMHE